MQIQIKKAVRGQRKLKMAIAGLSGTGKTMTALAIATALGKRVLVIDTENESASIYADRYDFEAIDLKDYKPDSFMEAIQAALDHGIDVLIIDSLSHQWEGVLELVDEEVVRKGSDNSFGEWRFATPQHKAVFRLLLSCPVHVIVTMRLDTKYVVEQNAKGKMAPRKVGLQPKQRENTEYEWDVMLVVDRVHDARVEKSRYSELEGKHFKKPDAETGAELLRVVSTGVDRTAADARREAATAKLRGFLTLFTPSQCLNIVGKSTKDMHTVEELEDAIAKLDAAQARKAQQSKDAAQAKGGGTEATPPVEGPPPDPAPRPESRPPTPLRAVPTETQTQHPGPNANQNRDEAQKRAPEGDTSKARPGAGRQAAQLSPSQRFWAAVRELDKRAYPVIRKEVCARYETKDADRLSEDQRSDYLEFLTVQAARGGSR